MAVIGANVATLLDWAKRQDPDGKTADIIEMLGQTNEILTDMLFMEGNLPTGHRTTARTGLPAVAWRLLNQGVAPSKSRTAQIDEACGMLEAFSQVDEELAKLNGNTAEYRLSEAQAFLEAINQEMSSTLFYGNSSVSPEEITGLANRYSSLSAENGRNIVSGAGGNSAENTSIWLVVWGAQGIHGIFPKGSKAGVEHNDLGIETVNDAGGVAGALMRAFRDQWKVKMGIALRDWRQVVRGANIDVSNLSDDTSAADLRRMMVKMIHRVHSLKMGKAVFYMNRTAAQCLDLQRIDQVTAGGGINPQNVDGAMNYSFRGIPIRICDSILETEDVVS